MIHATTVLAVRHRDQTVMASDGQVTFGNTVLKQAAKKIRRLYNDKVLAGFAGSAADSFALFSRFEAKLEQYRGNLERSAVELAKDWRTDRMLRRLEAMLVVMDTKNTYLLSGTGDLIEPDDGIIAVGSGGPYAMAAAKALAQHTELDARAIAQEAMAIAGTICIYIESEHHARNVFDPDGHSSSRSNLHLHRGADAASDRRRARQTRRRSEAGEARGCDRPAQPLAPAEAARPSWPKRSRRRTS